MTKKLYLIPSTIGETPVEAVIPSEVRNIINQINCYIVENVRTARRQLIKMGIETAIDDLKFHVLNKHTHKNELDSFLSTIDREDIGLLSEAGVPAVADPGSDIVNIAHRKGIQVVPLVGPSSILMALMASGLNGQCFAFHGYLPVKRPERIKKIKELEASSKKHRQTQIFIEAPYRNNQMLADILESCAKQTLVCVACNISCDDEFIKTKPVAHWKKPLPELHKKPTIFLVHQY